MKAKSEYGKDGKTAKEIAIEPDKSAQGVQNNNSTYHSKLELAAPF